MLSPESENEEFEFYLKFAKPLVLNLPDTNDRIKAATWIRYLKNDTTDSALRGDYLKLLLFVLQRRKLFGPFATIPDESKPLQKFPEEINIQDVAKNFVEVDKKILKATLEKGGYGEWPPYSITYSSDLTEYAASQEIPNFGVQAYFAISSDPLPQWDHFNKAIFPTGEGMDTSKLETTGSPDISCFVTPDQGEPALQESPRPSPRISPKGPPETPPKDLKDVSPKSRKDESPERVDEFQMESRVPPSWGSNLVNVKDSPSPTSRLFTLEELDDIEVSEQDMLDFFNEDIDLDEVDFYEASSYLQGDTFVSPPKAQPTSPLSPARSPLGSPRRPHPTSPLSPARSPMTPRSPSSPIMSPRRPHPTSPLSPTKSASPVTPPASVCKARPCVGRTPPSPKSSPSRRPLTPDTVFDALEHVATDKDMQDFYERPVTSPPRTTPDREEDAIPTKEVTSAVQQMLDEINEPSVSVLQSMGDLIQETIMDTSGEGLGGDSFIAPEKKDFGWLSDVAPGPGLPEDEEQDPALWESFDRWTDDPDQMFEYMPPSPREKFPRTPMIRDDDPYAAQRRRWADVEKTPPIFSRDPRIREGPEADRVYGIHEFGMESFEEPVWTSAEQYLKYHADETPFVDPRQIDRKSLDPSQYKYEYPKMARRMSEFEGLQDEAEFFRTEIEPDLINVTFTERDFQPMTQVQAAMEAIRTGPLHVGMPSPPPQKTPEADEGEWEDVKFLEETPPLFMLEPVLLATPPDYEPNPDIPVDEDALTDSIAKNIEEDLKIINAEIPVTTPQRSPSPKRPTTFSEESPPPLFLESDVEPEPYISSPEAMPVRHVIPPQKEYDWDINIGSPIKFKKSDAVVIHSEEELFEKNLKRKKELAVIYAKEYDSPPKIPSPPAMPHLMDEPIPGRRLPEAVTPRRLPPSNWAYKTPPKYHREPYVPKEKKIPTGISPPRPVSEDITMFYESPPDEILSPTMAVSSLMFSPPEDFGKEDSPVRSPTGRPAAPDLREYDEIDMERFFPTQFEEYEPPELYRSPPKPASPSPEKKAWKERVGAHERVPFRKKTFVVRPKPGRSYRITGAKIPQLEALAETSPEPQRQPSPQSIQAELDAEIAALEAELFQVTHAAPRARDPNELSPDYERKMWQETVKLHDLLPYRKRRRERYEPTLETIPSPRAPVDPVKEREKILREQKLQADRQVEYDMKQIQHQRTDRYDYNKLISRYEDPFRQIDFMQYWDRARPRQQISPPRVPSPPAMPHLMDEPIPGRRLPETVQPAKLPPPNWEWKTPPKYQREPHVPREKIIPTGISPPRPEDRPVFYESPPEELLSPSSAVSALMFTPPEDFGSEPSPVRSPEGRLVPYDAIDMEMEYPEDIDDFGSPEYYQSPPSPEVLSPEKIAWKEKVGAHERVPFRKKKFVVRPRPGRSYHVTGAKIPQLEAVSETSPEQPRPPSSAVTRAQLDAEIAALEEELFQVTHESPREPEPSAISAEDWQMWHEIIALHDPPLSESTRLEIDKGIEALYAQSRQPTPARSRQPTPARSRPQVPDGFSPDYERKMWQETIKLHDLLPYRKRRRERYKPTLETIPSPRVPVDPVKEREKILREQKLQADRQVEYDMKQIQHKRTDRYDYNKLISKHDDPFRKIDFMQYWDKAKPRQQISPPRVPSPPAMPHLMDEPIPGRRLPETVQPTRLPPSNWQYKTPPKYHRETYVPKEKIIPTGISPPRPEYIPVFYESPPEELLSPSSAVSALMFTPPEDFGREPSPVRSPEGRLVPYDAIDMEMEYPEDIDDFGSPEFYPSPPSPEVLSPEKIAWKEKVGAHERVPFRKKKFVVRPRPGRSYHVTGAKIPQLEAIVDTSPPEQRRPLSPEIRQAELDAEIAALEAELFQVTHATPRPRDPNELSPDYERKMWQETVKLHDLLPYRKRRRERYEPTLETIPSPRAPVDPVKEREKILREQKLQADRQVEYDMKQIQHQRTDRYDYNKLISRYEDPFRQIDFMQYWDRARPRQQISPPRVPSPPAMPHLMDEPIPGRRLPETVQPTRLPPSNWQYKTPPKYQREPYVPKEKIIPTGISPPRPVSQEIAMYFESPPEELLSPTMAVSPLMYSPPEGFGKEPSPVRSPGGRPITESMEPFDAIDLEMSYSAEFGGVDSPEFYQSPESPSPERRAWMESVEAHERVPYRKKTFRVHPTSGRSYKVKGAKIPQLEAVVDYSPPDIVPFPPDFVEVGEEPEPDFQTLPEFDDFVDESVSAEDFLDSQLTSLEAEFDQTLQREVLSPTRTPPTTITSGSPGTPEYLRKAWMQELALRDYDKYHKKTFVVKPKHGKSYRVTKSKAPKLTTVEEKYYELSPVSPPLKPRPYQPYSPDAPLPIVTTPPENWTYKTPSPLTRKSLLAESPSLIYSPDSAVSPLQYTKLVSKTPTEESISYTIRRKPVSPLRSPGGRPFQQAPMDAFEMAQIVPRDYHLIAEESPELYEYTAPSPPVPPPRPRTPPAFIRQPRRIPRRQGQLDPNVLYASTPKSAERSYVPAAERIRFEETRPIPMRPVSPEPAPQTYYETPIAPGTRPWKKRRKVIQSTARRRLDFGDEEEKELERQLIEDLEMHITAASPGAAARDMLQESPPMEAYGVDEVSMLGDFEYEPTEFNLYADEEAAAYDVRPAFEGQPDIDLQDTSPIAVRDELIPYEQQDFRWMDSSCGSRCPGSRRP